LVGGPASQDHVKASQVFKKLNKPCMCAVLLVFQSFEEWQSPELGLHPIQVALQVSLPEIDCTIEPIVTSVAKVQLVEVFLFLIV